MEAKKGQHVLDSDLILSLEKVWVLASGYLLMTSKMFQKIFAGVSFIKPGLTEIWIFYV